MDYSGTESNEFGVGEGAFWHSSMDLYYGFQQGEIVEVEHEPNKYWLATIEYSFKHLLLLKWVGDFGEFWIDTSTQNSTTTSSTSYNEFGTPKRLFQPGYHLQSQLKSQFCLERPTKSLVRPSLYNPANDPYANIKTVHDLLTHDFEQTTDTFGEQTNTNSIEHASLVMAKCKTKIAYGQEDVDELEAALQILNDIESDANTPQIDSPDRNHLTNSYNFNETTKQVPVSTAESDTATSSSDKTPIDSSDDNSRKPPKVELEVLLNMKKECNKENKQEPKFNYEALVEMCKNLQESALNEGKYLELGESSKKVYYLKPRQFFDMGGANHERVFVPGTLLEVCHTSESKQGLELNHWFATVLKNTGGRLLLRWFLCDEPKFKQGRLEIKSCRSNLLKEEEDDDESEVGMDEDKADLPYSTAKLPAKTTTFSMNFCNPCVHSISHARNLQRPYRIPNKIRAFMLDVKGVEETDLIEQAQCDHIFDYRRMNLDKDRPIIDHLLAKARSIMPQYLNLNFAPKDTLSRREVLLSTPRMTKLFRGFVKRQLESGVFEIHSQPLAENGTVIKFIYPYDSSYSVLPTSWAVNNQDCLSFHPSRNPTPNQNDNVSVDEVKVEKSDGINQVDFSNTTSVTSTTSPKLDAEETRENLNSCNFPSEPIQSSSSDSGNVDLGESLADSKHLNEVEPLISPHYEKNDSDEIKFQCTLNSSSNQSKILQFKVMDQLELVHPSSDSTICLGRIRKIVYPLLWIQISADSYTLIPFNSTEIYPSRWCENNNYSLVSLLPPRKRLNNSSQPDKKRTKKSKNDDTKIDQENIQRFYYEPEHFDLGTINDRQLDINYILNEKSMYIRIYFNHKCFTGPSLSKGKICSLPQYVGPGPLRLVMEEVMTKVISVAYVPPRILNDLSSQTFEELLVARGMTNTAPFPFKAKYQKRVHRESIPVCLNPDDVALYCECVCEHLKCCYNLFGPNLYDGDDCPGHCRALTKSNKFMKRATYYREKARLGEFINDNGNAKKLNNSSNNSSNSLSKTTRARYAGRDSSESSSSSVSRSDQLQSRASSTGDDVPVHELKENLVAVEELDNEDEVKDTTSTNNIQTSNIQSSNEIQASNLNAANDETARELVPEVEKTHHLTEQEQNSDNVIVNRPPIKWPNESEFNNIKLEGFKPEDWTVDDVANHLGWCRLDRFKPYMISEGVDGQALLLLDKVAIKEHFQHQPKSEYSQEEVGKLCRFVEFVKARAEVVTGI